MSDLTRFLLVMNWPFIFWMLLSSFCLLSAGYLLGRHEERQNYRRPARPVHRGYCSLISEPEPLEHVERDSRLFWVRR
jgi:hypothetical protein